MFQVDDYKVEFGHNYTNKFMIPKGVSCRLILINHGPTHDGPRWGGFAKLHPNEQADKNKGRKIALARALSASGFDKSTRARFWDAYFDTVSRKNDPRPGPSAREIKALRQCLKLPNGYRGELPIAPEKETT